MTKGEEEEGRSKRVKIGEKGREGWNEDGRTEESSAYGRVGENWSVVEIVLLMVEQLWSPSEGSFPAPVFLCSPNYPPH